ncbi:carbohydrate-binding module family 13 protein [Zasmidium cellare ATCC 36951]|uniref:Carbohydrate-binding module family 13 protein n=1 Tax=Zasmidium cellare ATCC 36951 TaxID=1080233 RepID=A0A6A6D2P4_ZASCE|nr:carbohydrate-binding module family 13 protein [Zasmidium cellare ATCC 36951]KAF2173651.1 carbohydrate-binding module family 13 protein [Zasmidium cellare ATCC 36951]
MFHMGMAAGSGTNFLNHGQLLAGLEDPAWFEQNVPILDTPNSQIQQVYYYRWGTYREHFFYTGPQFGYISTEFLLAAGIGYAAPYGGIVAAAGHHINEGRWLRDQKPGKDLVNFWLGAPGQASKPVNDNVNPDTSTWATEYAFWAASSVWRQYLATGDRDFAVGHLDNLVKEYRQYDNHFNEILGLYWQAPVWDATEYTAATYSTSNGDDNAAYHGGYGYRPTLNSYQYGDAQAIAAIATLAGNTTLATEYTNRASALQSNLIKYTWDSRAEFFKHLPRDNNPSLTLVTMREIMGFIPWQFNMALPNNYSVGFAQLLDPQGFNSSYGPTSTEQRSSWFFYDATEGCCRWDGPSWPFATAQTLTAVENLLNDYPSQSYISAADYFTLLLRYASTQFRNGKPYIAEAHWHNISSWIYDSYDHSEDYNHSTFVDNIIAGLIGLRGQNNDTLVINPLTPTSWNHWGLENTAYHGHLITVLWDSDGTHYNQGKGLRVWVDGTAAGNRDTLGPLTVKVGSAVKPTISSNINIAANPLQFPMGPQPNASFQSSNAEQSIWKAIDGNVWRVGIPENSSWTTSGSSNAQDTFTIDLRRPQSINNVQLYFYDNGTNVRVPTSYDLQYLPSNNSWTSIPSQTRSGTLANNAQITITFPQLTTQQIRITAPNHGNGVGWGLSEFQIWTPPIYQISNKNSNKAMAVQNGTTSVLQEPASNTTRWQFIPAAGAWSQIQHVATKKYLGVTGGSTANSTQLAIFDQDPTRQDLLWWVEDRGQGYFFIRNKKSNLVAGVDGESTNDGAMVVQYADTDTSDHYWSLLVDVPSS